MSPRARPVAPHRREMWRIGALVLGALVFLLHIYTLPTPQPVHDLLDRNYRDIVYHGGMLLSFALAYRFSFVGDGGMRPFGVPLAVLCVGSGWGALCELAQVPLHPAREFHWLELGLNTGVPALVAAGSALWEWSRRGWACCV